MNLIEIVWCCSESENERRVISRSRLFQLGRLLCRSPLYYRVCTSISKLAPTWQSENWAYRSPTIKLTQKLEKSSEIVYVYPISALLIVLRWTFRSPNVEHIKSSWKSKFSVDSGFCSIVSPMTSRSPNSKLIDEAHTSEFGVIKFEKTNFLLISKKTLAKSKCQRATIQSGWFLGSDWKSWDQNMSDRIKNYKLIAENSISRKSQKSNLELELKKWTSRSPNI